MKVLFTYIGVENLGVEYLIACARNAGHDVSLAFDPAIFGGHLMWDFPSLAKRFDKRPQIMRWIRDNRPDVVAFSCVSPNYLWSLELARSVKSEFPEIKTVFGGVHVTAVPERVIAEESVDAIILSEADISFPAWLNDLQVGADSRVPGLWTKKDGVVVRNAGSLFPEKLDEIPFPAKDAFFDKAPALEECYTIMSSRGCPFKCSYCHNSVPGTYPEGATHVRRRGAENVVAELEAVKARGRVTFVKFMDDVFPMQKKWLEEFAEKYSARVGLPYFCLAHPSMLNDDIIDILADTNCKLIAIGVQSADDGQRRNVMFRNYDNESIKRSVAALKKKRIMVSLDHILGIPGDTQEMMREAAEFYIDIKPDRLLAYWLTYFPGTKIVDIALEKGTMTAADKEEIESGNGGNLLCGRGVAQVAATKKYILFFSLIPLLPKSFVAFLLKSNLYKLLPGSHLLSNAAIALNAVIRRDACFIHNLKYIFSKKNAP